MSSEKNTLVRLATLKAPRDLSLGGGSGVTRGGVVRRKFIPNVNAAATAAKTNNQKLEASEVAVKTEKKNNRRDRSNERRGGKERRCRNDIYVQKRSVFDTMPTADVKSKSSKIGYSYSSSSLRPSTSSSSVRDSLVKVKPETKIVCAGNDDENAEEDDKEIVKKLISHSFIDDEDEEDEDDVEYKPLSLPLGGSIKKDFDFEVEVKPNAKVKSAIKEIDKTNSGNNDNNTFNKNSNNNDEDDEGNVQSLGINKTILTKSNQKYKFKKGEYYLVQMPSILPGNPPLNEEEINNMSKNKNNKKVEEAVKKQSRLLRDFPEGHMGKLRVHEGGGAQMLLGHVSFDCHQGPQSDCLQELGVAASAGRKGAYESLFRLGRVDNSMIVHPSLRPMCVSNPEEGEAEKETLMEEYDVYLCKPEDKAFYLFNLPLRCDLAQVRTGRLKPVCGRVQFDLEQWPRVEVDDAVKTMMTSSGCNILPKVFAIGVFHEDQFHLTPLNDIVQMRPDFKSFKVRNEDKTSDCEEDDGDVGAQLVNARMKVKETESAKNKRLASYQHLQSEERKEAWHELKVIDPTDHYRESLLISSSIQPCEFNIPWEDYLESLTNDTKPSESTETSLNNLNHLKLNEQVKWVMERCRAIDFQQLSVLLSSSAHHSEIIGYLEQFAVLIQGCWAVKSEHIISASNQGGVVLRALRDFVLFKFSVGEGVTLAQLHNLHHLNAEEEAIVLEGISRQDRRCRQRMFILEQDEDFARTHDEVVRRQMLLMKQKFEQIKLILPFRASDPPTTSHKHTKKL